MNGKIKILTVLMAAIIFSTIALHAYAGADAPETVQNEQKFNELFKEQAERQNALYMPHIHVWDSEIEVSAAEDDAFQGGSWSSAMRSGVAAGAADVPAMVRPEVQTSVMGGDFSQTNIQVEGVDEADIVKTDGNYIYHLTNNTLHIIEADGKGNMKTVSTTELNIKNDKPFYIAGPNPIARTVSPRNEWEAYFYPSEMYVDGDTLCMIGWGMPDIDISTRRGRHYFPSFTKAVVYDIKDRANPVFMRDFYVEGHMVSSRKVDDMLYLVVNHYMNLYGVDKPSDVVPLFRDSVISGNSFRPISYTTMRYFPNQHADSILIICGLDLSKPNAAAKVESVLGSGSNVYMSRESLYVTRSDFLYNIVPISGVRGLWGHGEEMTTFYKFGLKDGAPVYESQATLGGHVLNQYSMDEHNGHFRVAMTTNRFSDTDSKNTLTILDKNMKQTGKIEDMAPGEMIYSARFMGDRAFMVTFRMVDPLFAMDLSDPKNPKVLGELKIPGYSTYLHPYDENHLIGFGRDTEEMRTIDSQGRVVNEWAVNKGLKLSLFDVTDMTDPKEITAVIIGNEYTHSDLLHNPRAWLFNKEKGFVAFPVHHYSYGFVPEGSEKFDDFNGVYVYNIDTKGLDLRGTIEIKEDPPPRNPFHSFHYQNTVQRVLYIGDTFYSAFMTGMQANGMDDLNFIGAINYQ
jgi:uncharacterized secreted protein with C-terminal beta-propeller domain